MNLEDFKKSVLNYIEKHECYSKQVFLGSNPFLELSNSNAIPEKYFQYLII